MTEINFPLSNANVAQCMAERDAEIERLRAALLEVSNVEWQGATPETMLRLRLLAIRALKDKP